MQYPDGLKVRVASAAVLSPVDCYQLPKSDACVAVVLTLSNAGSTTLQLGNLDYTIKQRLLYGANQHEAESATYTGKELAALPRQLTPGSSESTQDVYQVPSLEALAVEFTGEFIGGDHPNYIFPDVQRILSRVSG